MDNTSITGIIEANVLETVRQTLRSNDFQVQDHSHYTFDRGRPYESDTQVIRLKVNPKLRIKLEVERRIGNEPFRT